MPDQVPATHLKSGQSLNGFIIEDVTPLASIRCLAIRATHTKSGARLLHLVADDPENLFVAAFRTPPPDDTGLPHILEHTVLCGSKRYPVKDPFVELLKTSLATFINAMTYPDKTVYPVASMNEKDYFNLAGVYCDAVFHPRIDEMHFKQEGHHYEFAQADDTGSALTIKGIVYNEMKGAYSDLDGVIGREMTKSICPDNAYGFDSGGNPEHIPCLDYETFCSFHKRYYHPSNALLLLYGNIDTEKQLAFLDSEYLSAFDAIEIDTSIAEQPRWTEPVRQTIGYPIGKEEELTNKTAFLLTFLTNDVTDPITSLSLGILDYYLLGNAASPLRKALIDSKLGEELSDSGYASHQRDTFFTIGLKGTETEHTEAIEKLIFDTCQRIAQQGMDPDKVEAAFHRLEIGSREIGSMYPLRLMDRVYRSWLYDADPLHLLRLDEHLKELRSRYETEPRFFEKQLEQWIVKNAHYSALTFVPDPEDLARRDKAFEEEMALKKQALSPEACETIARDAEALSKMQGEPNSPEALATLPRLSLEDVSPDPMQLPTVELTAGGRPFLHTDVFAGGVSYLRMAFDVSDLEDDLIDYLPLYGQVLHKMGAGDADYAAMAEREAAVTGGIHAAAGGGGRFDDCRKTQLFLTVGMKALDSKLPEALDVLTDRMTLCNPEDTERLRDVILQGKVHMHSRLIPGGSYYAGLHAAQGISRNTAIAERMRGVSQIRLFDRLARDFSSEAPKIQEKLLRIRDFLLSRDRVTSSFVGEKSACDTVRSWTEETLSRFRQDAPSPAPTEWQAPPATRVGVAVPADVAFCGLALPAIGATDPRAAALLFLGTQLSFGYMWNEVRVKGGAYGASASYDLMDGVFRFTSYRDPQIQKTLDVFAGSSSHVSEGMDLSAGALEQAIIGTVKNLDRPLRPEQAVNIALLRHLQDSTFERRKAFRKQLLALTAGQIRDAFAEVVAPAIQSASVCVISSREKLEAAESGLAVEDL